jgi:hypothetical protein
MYESYEFAYFFKNCVTQIWKKMKYSTKNHSHSLLSLALSFFSSAFIQQTTHTIAAMDKTICPNSWNVKSDIKFAQL